MRARYGAQRCRILQAGEGDKLRNVAFIETPRFLVGDVGEPFDFRGNVGQVAILLRRERTFLLILTSSFDTTLPGLLFLTR